MYWLTENSLWVMAAMIIFVVGWVIAFFLRNNQAKTQPNEGQQHKESGTTPLKNTTKL